mmetsp:Transcript_29953/g.45405  ORF Transcript_29953/g.45405 Transcript_29953/m.45405 type:complete len:97 (+) Transcript_29953:200-490(+)
MITKFALMNLFSNNTKIGDDSFTLPRYGSNNRHFHSLAGHQSEHYTSNVQKEEEEFKVVNRLLLEQIMNRNASDSNEHRFSFPFYNAKSFFFTTRQ